MGCQGAGQDSGWETSWLALGVNAVVECWDMSTNTVARPILVFVGAALERRKRLEGNIAIASGLSFSKWLVGHLSWHQITWIFDAITNSKPPQASIMGIGISCRHCHCYCTRSANISVIAHAVVPPCSAPLRLGFCRQPLSSCLEILANYFPP